MLLKNLLSRWPILAPLAGVLAFLVLAAVVSCAVPSCETKRLVRAASTGKAESQASQTKGEVAHTGFRLDSTRLAVRGLDYIRRDSALGAQEKQLRRQHPSRVVLPPLTQLPLEQ